MRILTIRSSVVAAGIFSFSWFFMSLVPEAQAEVKVSGFADVGYEADQIKTSEQSGTTKTSAFTIGDIDIFMQSNLGDDFSWLSETAFSAGQTNFSGIDVERLLVNFRPKDYFNIGLGRFHTALGYWNDTFHHGAWLSNSINRPYVYNFEDANGILPIHSVGIEIRGVFAQKFGYIINLANGRGPMPSLVQITSDSNSSKAVNALVYWNTPLKGLRIGAGYYVDQIASLPNDTSIETNLNGQGYAPHNGLNETISDAHLVYKAHDVEWINEYHSINHKYAADHVDTAMDDVKTTVTSVYSQLGYQIKDIWTPYVRYELINGDKNSDEWYLSDLTGNPLGRKMRHEIDTVGVRYDITDIVALKFEFAQDKLKNNYNGGYTAAGPSGTPASVAPSYSTATVTTNAIRTNVSFAF